MNSMNDYIGILYSDSKFMDLTQSLILAPPVRCRAGGATHEELTRWVGIVRTHKNSLINTANPSGHLEVAAVSLAEH